MNIINQEYSIHAAFLKEPWKKLTYKEIEFLSRKKSKSYIYRALSNLVKEGIISTEAVGKSILYKLEIESPKTQSYLGFLEEYKAWTSKHLPSRIVSNLGTKIIQITPFFIFIIISS